MIASVSVQRDGNDLAEVVRDRDRFEAWYAASLPRVYAYLYSRCGGDWATTEELTQEVFVEAIRARERFRGDLDGSVPWLIGIARHRLIDHLRSQDRDRTRNARIAGSVIEAAVPVGTSRLELMEILQTLPGPQRAALILFAVDGLPVREVARLIGRSEDATESLIRRARVAVSAAREASA